MAAIAELDTKAQRVSYLMGETGLEVPDVMEITGVSDPTVYRWQNDKAQPYDKYLHLLADATGWSYRWLKTGEGDRLRPDQRKGEPRQRLRQRPRALEALKRPGESGSGAVAESEEIARDPILGIAASAGDGSFEISEEVVGYVTGADAVSRPGRSVFWIFVRGDSMGKTFQKHTMVPVLRFTETLQDVQEDDVYFFRLEGAVMLKRLQRLPGGRIAVISDNEAYPRYEIQLDEGIDFEVLGRVLV